MAYQDQYQAYLEKIPVRNEQCKASGKRLCFGYTSDLDILIQWDVDIFNGILDEYLHEKPSAKEGETIDSMASFARIVSHYALHGLGGEIDISDEQVCTELEKRFITKPGLGGTCAQGAAALGAIGIPLIAHITDKSKPVCEWLDYDGLETISSNGERIPMRQAATKESPVRHMILQFSKGDVLRIHGEERTIPLSNRLIMDYDAIHKIMPVDPPFLQYIESNASLLYSYNISGFNAIIDADIMKTKLAELNAHYQIIKKQNPDCKIYFESAHYLNSQIRQMVFEGISEYADILGVNEEELVDFAEKMQLEADKEDLTSVLNVLEKMIQQYRVQGIVMHTKDYSLYFGNKMEEVDIEMGLTLGNLLSGTRARTGRYGNLDDCKESLSLALSETGVRFADVLEGMSLNHYACLVPSRYLEHPTCTIGLGDTFVAGMQICFM